MHAYPSRQEIEAARREVTISDAATIAMDAASRTQVGALEKRIPASLQGLFRVVIEDKKLVGLRLQPDKALDGMNTLLNALDIDPRTFRHGTHYSALYNGKELEAIIASPLPSARTTDTPVSVEDDTFLYEHGRDPRKTYTHHGKVFVGTYTLQDALRLPGMAAAEKQLLQRIAAQIPADVQGAFICHVLNTNGTLQVDEFGIAPNLVGRIAAEELLKVVAELRHQPPSMAGIGVKYHGSEFAFRRPDLDMLAEKLPPVGRALQ